MLLQAGDELRLGDEARVAGKYITAVEHYTEVLSIDKDNMEAIIKRAQVYFLQDQLEHALTGIKRALELDSKNIEVHILCTNNAYRCIHVYDIKYRCIVDAFAVSRYIKCRELGGGKRVHVEEDSRTALMQC